ncbi:androgen-induced gene 1 protein isoform X3 [Falco biarmicus]|uniref:Androgen induced 1 n=1 Tax=Falco tinnunculus TaxID=100819 RepID=A0A8C4V758_FALTI|nr:androgen-induced gene 1 protein isoform X2 [Falco naumanni]XP_055569047.1 androgen-induced gene 1 protein isoform X3 [Falco cherrug]XP_055665565.1 androgen-induced gene 1 protein isoform X3 [Falco peregrinus]XP_056198396.1 androgen-induced gene 1 protein isoform X3 [Falco biarmicus]
MALVPCQVLRAAILLSYCSILCNYKAIDMPAHQTYGGSWKFLTFIDLVIQAVFFGICVLTDLSSLLTKGNDSQEQERQLKKLISLRDWVMAVLAFPVGVFVVTMFWSIYIYDRELVYPKLLDNFIPAWLNHGMEPSGIQQVSGAEVPLRLGWIFHSLLTFWSLVCLRWSCKTEPQKAYNSFALCINRDENNTSSVSQQELWTGCSVHLRCWLYFMGVLDSPCYRSVGVPTS